MESAHHIADWEESNRKLLCAAKDTLSVAGSPVTFGTEGYSGEKNLFLLVDGEAKRECDSRGVLSAAVAGRIGGQQD